MFRWIKNFFNREKPNRIWAFSYFDQPWVKVVSPQKPNVEAFSRVVGPFRSEIDCEEFCDQANVGHPFAKKYNEQPSKSVRT